MKRTLAKREYIICALILLALLIAFTFPFIARFDDATLCKQGDSLLNAWTLRWQMMALSTSGTGIFDGNILYPQSDVILFSEHLLGIVPVYAIFYGLTGNPIFAYNLTLFFGMIICGIFVYALVKYISGSREGAMLAAVVFTLLPYRLSMMGHLQMAFIPLFPAGFLFLHKYLDGKGRKNSFLCALCFLYQGLCSWYIGIIMGTGLALMLIWHVASSRGSGIAFKLRLGKAIGASLIIIIAGSLLLPIAWQYIDNQNAYADFKREREEIYPYSVRPSDFMNVLEYSIVYGFDPDLFSLEGFGSEKVLFPGVTAVFISVFFLVGISERKRHNSWSGFYIFLIAASFVLMIGIATHRWLPYELVFKLPMFNFIRVTARFALLFFLGLSVFVGMGAGVLLKRLSGRELSFASGRKMPGALFLMSVLIILLACDYSIAGYAYDLTPTGENVPDVYKKLAELKNENDGGTLIELPMFPQSDIGIYDGRLFGMNKPVPGLVKPGERVSPLPRDPYIEAAFYEARHESTSMLYSTYHWMNIVNGYSGYIPQTRLKINFEMQSFPTKRSIELLKSIGVEWIVWHRDYAMKFGADSRGKALFANENLELIEDYGNEVLFRIKGAERWKGTWPEESEFEKHIEAEVEVPAYSETGTRVGFSIKLFNKSDSFLGLVDNGAINVVCEVEGEGGQKTKTTVKASPPMFLAPGEGASVYVEAEVPEMTGKYSLTAKSNDARIPFELEADFTVVESLETSAGKESVEEVECRVLNMGKEATSDSLIPLSLKVVNNSDFTLLRESPIGVYTVKPALAWFKDGEFVKHSRATLPCDLAPDEEIEIFSLVRAPHLKGVYEVHTAVVMEGVGWKTDEEFFKYEVK